MEGTGRKIALATLVAGTLDILSACIYTLVPGHSPIEMLKILGSAVLGDHAMHGGAGAAITGLLLHFAIMTIMAAIFVLAAQRWSLLKTRWLIAGIAYGLILWAVMNLIVVPLRFGPSHLTVHGVIEQLFSHIVLVGIPIAWFARR